jgi:hypothetical protein
MSPEMPMNTDSMLAAFMSYEPLQTAAATEAAHVHALAQMMSNTTQGKARAATTIAAAAYQ